MAGNGGQQLSVPPGFRFHPTEEELLYYYLRKKVSYEPIDLDVIREVDLNRLEPWDLNDKCGIGSGPQNEWYFFSHKDKKYPTGTRTNRATMAGFWKATGRDKAIHLSNSTRIGMRKTLVFYTGRAPHGHKTDWIMHEYRLDEDSAEIQEDGWVVCRAFKKKSHTRSNNFHTEIDQDEYPIYMPTNAITSNCTSTEPNKLINSHDHQAHDYNNNNNSSNHMIKYMHLPQLTTCPESTLPPSLLSGIMQPGKFSGGDWSFLDKLLATNQNQFSVANVSDLVPPPERFPFPYHN